MEDFSQPRLRRTDPTVPGAAAEVISFPPSSPSAGGQSVAQATAKQLAEMPVKEARLLKLVQFVIKRCFK